MIIRRLAIPLFLILPMIANGARPRLSVVPGISGAPRELTLQGSSPGLRLQLFDGIHPIGVMIVDSSGSGHFTLVSLPPGQHTVRAVEWGTGNTVADSLRFTLPSQTAGSLAPAVTHATGIRPVVMATADLDGEGLSSVILADESAVSLLRNTGGTFAAPVKLAPLSSPSAIVVQDFNGDGLKDLAIASQDGRVAILLNRGGGQFAPAVYAAAGASPSAMVAADFNGDGIPDLAVANREGNDVSILLGNGDGSFKTAAAIPGGNSPRSLVVADFNGDGLADLASANFLGNNVSVLLGNGKGGFRIGGAFTSGNGPATLLAADFDEDGAADLAVLNQLDGNVVVMLNDRSGAFPSAFPPGGPPVLVPKKSRVTIPNASSLSIADMNGDGHADLIIQSGDAIQVRNGRGDGSFGKGYSTPAADSPQLIAVGNFNSDGRLDLVAIDPSGKLAMSTGNEMAEHAALSGLSPDATNFPTLTITFEGLRDQEEVLNYYNGMTGSAGSGPGPSYGVTFGSAALATISSANGGTGNFSHNPSGDTVAFFLNGGNLTMNVPSGFTTGFSFWYDNGSIAGETGGAGSVVVYNASNQALNTISLPVTGTGCFASGVYDCWQEVGVQFSGTATSVSFAGAANFIAFDNITINNPIAPKLIITTTSLPAATVNVGYFQTLTAINGVTPYLWTATGLPNGLVLTSTGIIEGIPTVGGTFTVTVTATDSSKPVLTSTQTLSLFVFQPACTFSLPQTSASLAAPAANSMFAVNLSTGGCQVAAVADPSSPFVQNVSVNNNGGTTTTIGYSVTSNAGAGTIARTGQIDITVTTPGLQTGTTQTGVFNITQAGTTCNYSLPQPSQTFPSSVGTGSFAVAAQAGCQWSVASNVPWMNITSGSPGAGNGTVNFSVVQTNQASFARTGKLNVSANGNVVQTYIVTQTGTGTSVSCTDFVLTPTSAYLEGRTELLGNLTVNCTGLPGNLTADILLNLNTNVTSTVNGSAMDAMLTSGNTILNGQLLGNTTLHWPSVPLTSNFGNTSFTISNVRADASLLGPNPNSVPITGQVTITSTVPTPVTGGPQVMANAVTTLSFQVLQTTSPATGVSGTIQQVSYQEVTPAAFHTLSINGPATTFRLVLTNIPQTLQVWVPVYPNGGSTQGVLYSADCSGNGGGPITIGTTFGGVLYSQLPVNNGTAFATWQVLSTTNSIDTLTFPLLVSGNGFTSAWSLIQVVGSYAPASPAGPACSSVQGGEPSATVIPRYLDPSVPLVYGNFRVTPTISLSSTGLLSYSVTVVNEGSTTVKSNIREDAPGAETFALHLSPDDSGSVSGNTNCSVPVVAAMGGTGGINNCPLPPPQGTMNCASTTQLPTFPNNAAMNCSITTTSPTAGQLVNGGGIYTDTTAPPLTGQLLSITSPVAGNLTLLGVAIDPEVAVGSVQMSVMDPSNNVVSSGLATIGLNNTTQNPLIATDCNLVYPQYFGCLSNQTIGFSYSVDTTQLKNQVTYTVNATATNMATPTNSINLPSQTFSVMNQPLNFTVMGQVTLNGAGLAGVSVCAASNCAVTGSSGNYTLTLGANGSFSLTASLSGYSFSGPIPINNISANLTGQNFTASTIQLNSTVTGTVTLNGAGLSGVSVCAGSNCTPTNSAGNYTLTLALGGSYSLTASLSPFTFSGPLTINNLNSNLTGENFTATLAGFDFYPITPCRIADTRTVAGFTGQFGPPSLAAGVTRIFNVLSSPCASSIPPSVAAYSFNFTVIPPATGPAANLTTWPTGLATGMPNVSTLNYYGSVIANAAIVPAGTNGSINVFANLPTDMLFDINGYFAPPAASGLEFFPVTPCRIADTRSAAGFTGQFGPPSLVGQATRTFNVTNSPCAAGIPSTVAAYSFNFTVVPPSTGPAANLTTWPTGLVTGIPNVSTLNYYGSVIANAAIVPSGSGDAINVFASFPTDMLFDINGYFAPPTSSGLHFYPITPCRVADTRSGAGFSGNFGPPSLAGGGTRTFNVLSSPCAAGIPSTVAAYSFNFTVVPPSGGPAANLTMWPTGPARPNVSTLNYYGSVIANAAIVPAGTSGQINVFASFPTDMLFDINGYFAP